MKSGFLTELDTHMKGDKVHVLDSPLVYVSELLDTIIEVPAGFETDLASVPRIPIIYELWGNRAHREAVIHDYLYRYDSIPLVARPIADAVFREAMKARGVSWWIRWPMWAGVCLGGWGSYHKRSVRAELF